MLQYIIDGFNIVHKIPSVKSSDNPQYNLIHYIRNNKLTGSLNNKVTIIFDGMPDMQAIKEKEFKIMFSQDCSADDLIKRKISEIKRTAKFPMSEVIVVSDDRELRDYAKKEGAVSQRAGDFLYAKSKTSQKEEAKDISYPLQREITDELRKIWLKEK